LRPSLPSSFMWPIIAASVPPEATTAPAPTTAPM
jgi:hypothetical protein